MGDKHLLENKWTLWFHKINDNDWTIDSYKKVFTFNDIESFIVLFKKINNFSAGMFFLMKEDIKPLWENKENINGGYWSFKVLKKNINEIWYRLSSQIIGNNCLKNLENHSYINGISLSPKINNCIIKIWFSNLQTKNNIFDIQYLESILKDINFKESRFIKHSK